MRTCGPFFLCVLAFPPTLTSFTPCFISSHVFDRTNCPRSYRSDRISHMRDFFASAAPEDLFQTLDSKGWDVEAACAVFGDGKSEEGGSLAPGKPAFGFAQTSVTGGSEERGSASASGQGWPFKIFFDGVAEELRGRRGKPFATPHRQQSFHGNHSQMPSPRFGT